MDINDITKLILVLGVTFSIVGISYQVMRLIAAVTENLKDLRRTVQNIGVITDELIEDQRLIKGGIQSFVNVGKKAEEMVASIQTKVINPLTELFAFVGGLKSTVNKVTKRFNK